MPSPARLKLSQIGVFAQNPHLADDAAIAVPLVKRHGHGLSEDGLRQMGFGFLAVRLAFFGGVNACQSDHMLLTLRIEDRDGVAIGHFDHPALQFVSPGQTQACKRQAGDAQRFAQRRETGGNPHQCASPTASLTHFLMWLFLAAPASLRSAAEASHWAVASFSHFFRNEFLAAPASFFSAAAAVQLLPWA